MKTGRWQEGLVVTIPAKYRRKFGLKAGEVYRITEADALDDYIGLEHESGLLWRGSSAEFIEQFEIEPVK